MYITFIVNICTFTLLLCSMSFLFAGGLPLQVVDVRLGHALLLPDEQLLSAQ